jgi:16S rRNA (cytidine1402-2'-O)-methyltransferase
VGAAPGALATTEPRGEYVVVVGPAPPPAATIDDALVHAAVVDALDSGMSARDAAASVAADLGVPRRRVYELAVRERSQHGPRERSQRGN